jgi:hypothetical protein
MALPVAHNDHKQEVRVWALILLWAVVTMIAGYILWAKVSGF